MPGVWVAVERRVLQAAQDSVGLSNERLAAQLNMTSKTWERRKTEGRLRTDELDRVADVLGLTVERPAYEATVALDGDGLLSLLREQVVREHELTRQVLREGLAAVEARWMTLVEEMLDQIRNQSEVLDAMGRVLADLEAAAPRRTGSERK